MLRLNNVKISVRIAIACLVPMLAFIAFAFKDILDKHSIYSTADKIATIAHTAPEISGLIHELQKERGSTAGYVNSKGASFAEALRNQRPAICPPVVQELLRGAYDQRRMNRVNEIALNAASSLLERSFALFAPARSRSVRQMTA